MADAKSIRRFQNFGAIAIDDGVVKFSVPFAPGPIAGIPVMAR
jgi:hypothetical protein